MQFYLGTHKACWLKRVDVPLFVSRRTLAEMKSLPKAKGKWALDSGAFTEINDHGKWTIGAWKYIDEVRRFRDQIGGLEWAAIQDWPCEPGAREKTGLSVREHQRRTTHSYLTLKSLAPEIPWVPVLQGWHPDDYLAHLEEYERAVPFPLSQYRLVGVGSVCRRQKTEEALEILRPLHASGLRLHGFGFKISGLYQASSLLASADSLAWSRAARYEPPLAGCTHKTCANCMRFALEWRRKVLKAIEHGQREYQPTLFEKMPCSLPASGI